MAAAAILNVWNSFSFAFLTISDPTQTFIFFQNSHFGCPKFIFICISRHFRSNSNFKIQLSLFLATGGHFGCPKSIFVCISHHFIPKRNLKKKIAAQLYFFRYNIKNHPALQNTGSFW
jgi:hypothetical protein